MLGDQAWVEVHFDQKQLSKLLFFALIGGWVSGALGLGGGAIFNPLLLSMGVPPPVSSATGMYMIMFSTAGSSIIYMLYQVLDVQYALWLGFWCSMGSIAGLYILNQIMKKFNRQSPIVFLLAFVLGLSTIMVPLFGAIDIYEEYLNGQNIMKFNSFC